MNNQVPFGLSYDRTTPFDYEPDTSAITDRSSLTYIADLFGTDKGTIYHNYTAIYETYLQHLRYDPLVIVEIGVACGASLKMWSSYFKDSRILGYDINNETLKLCKAWPNVTIDILDATKQQIPVEADIFIDDASHISKEILDCLLLQWPKVKPGGFYIIEDIECTYSEQYAKEFTYPKNQADFDRAHFLQLMDILLRTLDQRSSPIEYIHFYRELCIIKKSSNAN